MTFDQIRSEVLERCNLTSPDASTRVGAAINRHYKRITSLLGMETVRVVTIAYVCVIGTRRQVIPGVEKIDRIFDITDPLTRRLLPELSIHNERSLDPGTGAPGSWAMQEAGAGSVVIALDTSPQVAYNLSIDGWVTRSDLTGSQEPSFPASFHDILTWFVLSEELLRKEKGQLASIYEEKANGLLNDLRFHLADTHTRELVQGNQGGNGQGQGGGGGGAPAGEVSYIQTGLITFDRDPAAPFAVTPGSAVVPNLDADKVDGRHEGEFALLAGRAGGQILQGDIGETGSLALAGSPTSGTIYINGQASPIGAGTILIRPGAGGFISLQRPDGAPAFNISATGVVDLQFGHLLFPLAHNPSTNVTTLDDYREGNWTPVWSGSVGNSGQVYSVQAGTYIKAGRLVVCSARLTLSTLGTITGDVSVIGLPFPAVNTLNSPGSLTVTQVSGLAFNVASMTGWVFPAEPWVSIKYVPAAGGAGLSNLPATALTASTDFQFTVTYFAAN